MQAFQTQNDSHNASDIGFRFGFYFTSLHFIYYCDLGGVVYSIDNNLNHHRTNCVSPNPTTIDLNFFVGPFCYRIDENLRLYSLRDSPTNPWILKATYSTIQEVKASLKLDGYHFESLPLDTRLPNMPNSLEMGDLGLVRQEVRSDSFVSVPQSVSQRKQSRFGLIQASGSDFWPSSSPADNPANQDIFPAVDEIPAPPTLSHITFIFSSKGDIDRWVESLKSQRKRKSSARPELRCPLKGCRTTIRRPQALKEHLYAHRDIRPFKCSRHGCNEAFAIPSNRDRHIKTCTMFGV